MTKIYFLCTVDEGSIPEKPDSGCPAGTKPSGEHCCCDGLQDCCWHKCPMEGTQENLDKLEKCGIKEKKWAYGKLARNGDEPTFVAQGCK